MRSKLTFLIFLIFIYAITLYLNFVYPNYYLHNISLSLLGLIIIYFIINIIFLGLGLKSIKNERTRYSFNKTAKILFYLIFGSVILNIWIPDPKTLLFSLGVLGAGVTLAAQDLLRNFIGGIVLIINNVYKTGDRIQIDDKVGDVIDINILYTYILECKEWIDGDQATGRITTIPNLNILTKNINNYTKDHDFLWDEIFIPISYGTNWEKASKIIKRIAKTHTKALIEKAEKGYSRLKLKYYVPKKNFDPEIFITITDNWITIKVRYITEVRSRRMAKNELSKKILKELTVNKDIGISSSTSEIEISSVPEIKLKK